MSQTEPETSCKALPKILTTCFKYDPKKLSDLENLVECLGCGKTAKFNSVTCYSSNLKKHLESSHASHQALLDQFLGAKETARAESTSTPKKRKMNLEPTGSPLLKVALQNSSSLIGMLKSTPYQLNHPRRIAINKALADLIIGKSLPLSLIDSKEFHAYTLALNDCYTPPTSKTLTKSIVPKLYDALKAQLIQILSTCTNVQISLDIWTDATLRSFLGVNVHAIDSSWRPLNALLGCIRVHGSHTAVAIIKHFQEVTKHYNIDHKVFKVRT